MMKSNHSEQLSSDIADIILGLTALALGNKDDCLVPIDADWEKVNRMSSVQGVTALVYDGIQALYRLHPDRVIPLDKEYKALKYDWFGSVLSMELSYDNHIKVVKDLFDFYRSNGIKMLLLKGLGLSVYYPIPSHRPTGDIDIYLFGRQREGDRIMSSEKGISIKTTSEHHTVFSFEGVTVENHYDFINTRIRKSGKPFDALLKSSVSEPTRTVFGSVIVPDPQFNMLFLMKHMSGHFASEGIAIRHILDWALFIKSESNNLDWGSFYSICKTYNTDRFVSAINAICVDHLGFDSSFFPILIRDQKLETRVLNEVLAYQIEHRPRGFVKESIFRVNKWFKTRWKQRICYRDSMISSFCTSLVSSFVKSKSI